MIKKILIAIGLPAAILTMIFVFTGSLENGREEELKIIIMEEGIGDQCVGGDTVVIHYAGMLEDGEVFDSSIERDMPFVFTLGSEQVIEGWEKGVLGMRVGEKRRIIVPSDMVYGEAGTPGGPIPPNATLIFEIELLEIQ